MNHNKAKYFRDFLWAGLCFSLAIFVFNITMSSKQCFNPKINSFIKKLRHLLEILKYFYLHFLRLKYKRPHVQKLQKYESIN